MKRIVVHILAAVILTTIPKLYFGQAPNLGTASQFVLFSSVGAVTNAGTSYSTHLTGHVGANSGAITGFGNVDGNMYAGGPESAQCAVDVLSAYTQLNVTVATLFPAPLLGNGQTLIPGVYSIASPATLNLDLNLDALGNPNAVFIIKIQGSFSANANSKVKLINGAKACNVFWKIEGLVSMASGTSMKGTIIANNAAINISTGDTLEGRALSTNGAVSVSEMMGYTPIGCGSPLLTGPNSPTLASIACYALFSSDGPLNNSGTTIITGDIGTNNGSTVGYNPLFVTGMIHAVPDASTGQCATDLFNVYTYLNTLPNDILLLYPAQFGHNLVLTPHTYLMNGAVTLIDSLYLNGEGNPNAVFVIQINGALSTSVNSKIILTNGTQSKNVYWKVDGAVSINSNSIFRGTIICNNAAMNFATGVNLDGRALTTTGALGTIATTVTIPSSINFMSQPMSQTVCAGSSVSFSMSAAGPGLVYQWRKGIVNLVNSGNISGATTATLTINPASVSDMASNYNVVILGACSPSETSVNVSLTVNTSPSITALAASQTVCAGSSITFSANTTGSGLTYQWRKGIVNLVNTATISGATSPTLTINPVNSGDASANYNLVINGGCAPNFTSVNVGLVVNTSPSITAQAISQTVCPGSSAVFSIAAIGSGLTYQWRKGNVNLSNVGNISGSNTATLTINPAGNLDIATNYNVIIIGVCSPNYTSSNASLEINKPSIITEPTGQSVCEGGSVSFSTTSTGSGLTYQWRKGTINLNNSGNISGTTTGTLTIYPASMSDVATNYNVVVSGDCSPSDTSVNAALLVNDQTITTAPVSQTVCAGNSASFSVAAIGQGLSYQWRKGSVNLINSGNISGATSAALVINPATNSDASSNYNVILMGTCALNDTSAFVTLLINAVPTADASTSSSVCAGSSISLATQSISGATYSWKGPNGYTSAVQNPIILNATNLEAGIYSVSVLVGSCVSNTSAVNVDVNNCEITDFFIPEGFSPNADGINDVFVIRGILNYPKNTFLIYNRWGDKVFDANSYQNSWDGKATKGLRFGADELPIGTYFYLLDLGDGSPVFKGTIYLNR